MKIAIIGAGNVGSTLGKAWAKKDHEVFFGVRNPQDDKTRQLIQSIGGKVQAGTVAEAAAFGQVVVLAMPWQATEAAVRAAGDLGGKTVIDCTNPVKADFSGLDVGFGSSGAEQVAQWAKGAKVFKAFNTTGYNVMADPVINGVRTAMFVCGDDEMAKPAVMQLATDVGFDAVDAGKLAQARLLEPLALLWISLAFGTVGRDFGFALLRRGKQTVPDRTTFENLYAGQPPWDIGKPQKAFVDVADRITGRILDAGCGTGENAMFFAARGCAVTGVDFLEEPIRQARQKATERGSSATFLVMDALTLKDWSERFDNVIDSGLFHVFSDEDRKKYIKGLATVLKPGGRLSLMCFSDEEPGTQGPRRVSKKELHDAFAEGWSIESIQPRRFEVRADFKDFTFSEGGPKVWFVVGRRAG